jgi:hypothetical protein
MLQQKWKGGKNVLDNFFLVVLWWYAHKAKKKNASENKKCR